ncbi:MAG: DUF456 domain-containing protein [Opitutales bacterium]|nr:DUF456 domain-containing protein [Opitutales bacterium]
MDALLYLAVLGLLVLGVVGAVVPVLPGPVLGLAALVAHKILAGPGSVSWTFLAVAAAAVAAAAFVDLLLCGAATRLFGGTRQGMIGAVFGLVAGFLLLGPIGLFVGPVLGAVLFEWIEQRSICRALRAGAGATAGTLAAVLVRTTVAAGLLIGFLAAV